MAELCADCGASFGSPATLVTHMKTAHEGGDSAASLRMNPAASTPGFLCGLCGKSFATEQDLSRHNLLRPERRRRTGKIHAVRTSA